MAFKKLHRRGLVIVGIPTEFPPNMHPRDYGWTDQWGGWTDDGFMKRILSDPEDFRLGHDVLGADVMSPDHFCLNPGTLPRILGEHLGIADLEALFDSREVANEVRRLLVRKRSS